MNSELAKVLKQVRAIGVQVIVASRNVEPKNGLDLGFDATWLQQDTMDPWRGSNFEAAVSAAKCSRCIVIGDFSVPGVLRCALGAQVTASALFLFHSGIDGDDGRLPSSGHSSHRFGQDKTLSQYGR